MKNCFLIINLLLITISCKKKTDTEVKLYNPYLDEYVSGATIAIIERKGNFGGGGFSGSASCKEVATAVTDANGTAVFNDTKLKTRDGYVYYPVLKEAWGIMNNYPCGGYNGVFLKKGGSNTIIKSDRTTEGILNIQYNNLFNPAMAGDSINFVVNRVVGYDPELEHTLAGSGLYRARTEAFDASVIYPTVQTVQDTKINGEFNVYTYKRKLGVVTVTEEIIKAYPNQLLLLWWIGKISSYETIHYNKVHIKKPGSSAPGFYFKQNTVIERSHF